MRRSVAIVRPWSYTSWVAFTVFYKSLATGNRRIDGAPTAAGSTQLLVKPPRLAAGSAAFSRAAVVRPCRRRRSL